jgi:translation initiation factor IF-2
MDRRMAKKRVHEIATDTGLPLKEVLEKLQNAGLSVKAPASAVDENEAKRILGVNGGTQAAARAAPDPVVPRRAPDPVVPGRSAPVGGRPPGARGGRDRAGGPRERSGQRPAGPRAGAPEGRGPAAPREGRAPAAPREAGRPAAPGDGRSAPRAPRDEAAAPAAGRPADGGPKRPTRDSLQGERAPGAGPGGRRRVVIDSQASRRQPGGPPPTQQPPRRGRRGRRRRGYIEEEPAPLPVAPETPARELVRIPSGATVKEVAEHFDVPVPEVIKRLMQMGEMATLTQTLSEEAVGLLAAELDKDVEIVHAGEEEAAAELVYEDDEADLVERPPVVTIMGHVDHGKTSLLDAIRETEVARGEAGGITQHIGAYQVRQDGRHITFLDTPGHQAFTAMRARGASVTDIAVIVVAADDGVKPQTEEAIDHARAAGVPMLVAVNKIDKEGAQPDRVRAEMAAKGLQPVEWGGDTEFVDVSAKTKQGLNDLLETILVMAEVEELRANPSADASGAVIESRLDPGRGPVVTVLVQRGTLRVGDALVAGAHWGRVRAMHDFLGHRVREATPGEPVEVLGFDSVPEAGETVRAVENDRRARQLAQERASRLKAEALARRAPRKASLEDLLASGARDLNLVLKADVAGSLEAIEDEIAKLPYQEVAVGVIGRGVGGITESDVMLASASDAIILGFNVRPVGDARAAAEREGVEIRTYSVIYRAIDDLRAAMEGLLEPEEVEQTLGRVEVRATFRASRVGTIAGCYVTEGRIVRGARARLVRDGTVVWEGQIASLRRFQDDVREVAAGFECGIVLQNFADIKEGDELEAFETRTVERELQPS